MADTQRTLSDIATLLGDNVSGDISAQDIRDAITTLQSGHASMYVTAAAATTFANPAEWTKVAGTTTTTVTPTPHNWAQTANNELTYSGTSPRVAHIAASVSMTSGGNNKTYRIGLAVNGTVDVSTIERRKIGTGADVGAAPITGVVQVSNGDTLGLYVWNETDTTTFTADRMNLSVVDYAE